MEASMESMSDWYGLKAGHRDSTSRTTCTLDFFSHDLNLMNNCRAW